MRSTSRRDGAPAGCSHNGHNLSVACEPLIKTRSIWQQMVSGAAPHRASRRPSASGPHGLGGQRASIGEFLGGPVSSHGPESCGRALTAIARRGRRRRRRAAGGAIMIHVGSVALVRSHVQTSMARRKFIFHWTSPFNKKASQWDSISVSRTSESTFRARPTGTLTRKRCHMQRVPEKCASRGVQSQIRTTSKTRSPATAAAAAKDADHMFCATAMAATAQGPLTTAAPAVCTAPSSRSMPARPPRRRIHFRDSSYVWKYRRS